MSPGPWFPSPWDLPYSKRQGTASSRQVGTCSVSVGSSMSQLWSLQRVSALAVVLKLPQLLFVGGTEIAAWMDPRGPHDPQAALFKGALLLGKLYPNAPFSFCHLYGHRWRSCGVRMQRKVCTSPSSWRASSSASW